MLQCDVFITTLSPVSIMNTRYRTIGTIPALSVPYKRFASNESSL
jgi:hypothetical protein